MTIGGQVSQVLAQVSTGDTIGGQVSQVLAQVSTGDNRGTGITGLQVTTGGTDLTGL